MANANRLEELRERQSRAKAAKAQLRPKPQPWQVGDLVRHEGKIWRVGHRSDLRMRLDPISAKQIKIFDHTMNDYGGSINVSPESVLEKVDPNALTDQDRRREAILIARGEVPGVERVVDGGGGNNGGTMVDKPVPPSKHLDDRRTGMSEQMVAMPPTGAQKANKERLAALRAKNRAGKIQAVPATKAQAARTRTNGSGEKSKATNPCMCGCGELVKGYFYQGHDARFKGWLLKIERGVMAVKELPKSVQNKFEWRKKGEGFVPTKDYKGNPHKGYDLTNR